MNTRGRSTVRNALDLEVVSIDTNTVANPQRFDDVLFCCALYYLKNQLTEYWGRRGRFRRRRSGGLSCRQRQKTWVHRCQACIEVSYRSPPGDCNLRTPLGESKGYMASAITLFRCQWIVRRAPEYEMATGVMQQRPPPPIPSFCGIPNLPQLKPQNTWIVPGTSK